MNHSFKRILIMPILYLFASVSFGLTTFLRVSIHDPFALFSGIMCIFFLIQFIWSVSTPFVIIGDGMLTVYNSQFNKKHVFLKKINRLELKGLKRADIYSTDGSKVRVHLTNMAASQKEEFAKVIKEISQSSEFYNELKPTPISDTESK